MLGIKKKCEFPLPRMEVKQKYIHPSSFIFGEDKMEENIKVIYTTVPAKVMTNIYYTFIFHHVSGEICLLLRQVHDFLLCFGFWSSLHLATRSQIFNFLTENVYQAFVFIYHTFQGVAGRERWLELHVATPPHNIFSLH